MESEKQLLPVSSGLFGNHSDHRRCCWCSANFLVSLGHLAITASSPKFQDLRFKRRGPIQPTGTTLSNVQPQSEQGSQTFHATLCDTGCSVKVASLVKHGFVNWKHGFDNCFNNIVPAEYLSIGDWSWFVDWVKPGERGNYQILRLSLWPKQERNSQVPEKHVAQEFEALIVWSLHACLYYLFRCILKVSVFLCLHRVMIHSMTWKWQRENRPWKVRWVKGIWDQWSSIPCLGRSK